MSSTLSPLFTWRAQIAKSDLPAPARHIALTLSLHMSEIGDSCFPSIATVMRETGLARGTVCKHMKTLEDTGWLERSAGGGRNSTRYTSRTPAVHEVDGCSPGGGHEVVIESVIEEDLSAAPQPRERNIVWDALVAVMGFEPTAASEKGDFAKTVREIQAIIPPDATFDQARTAMLARRRAYEHHFEGAAFTHRVLRGKWTELGALVVGNGLAPPSLAFPTERLAVEDFREWRRTATRDELVRYQHAFDVDDQGEALDGGF